MSREEVAAFLRRVAEDGLLRAELATIGARYGFRFSADELASVGIAPRTAVEAPLSDQSDDVDDDPGDPGFGIIEVPA
jgi:hypothetical protein